MISLDGDLDDVRSRLSDWIRANLPGDLPSVYAEGGLSRNLEWEHRLAGAGLGAVQWPVEYGGAGASQRHFAVFQEECIRAGAPERLNRMALGLLGPTLIQLGSAEQRDYYLPRIISCEDLWCQGFSEPEAGSDLARVSSRAEIDGSELVITGEKIWTSLAVYANWMFALVRTSGRPGEHAGLTFVLIPLDADGVTVRPIRQLHGEPGFAQVEMSGVRIPLTNVIGDLGHGWQVAMACLGYERGSGLGTHIRFSQDVVDLVRLANECGAVNDPVIRDAIAARYVETEVFRHHIHTQTDTPQRNGMASVTKLFWSEMQTRIFETALDILGPLSELSDTEDRPGVGSDLQRRYWHARGAQIFAGTSEIQRNVIGERLLGLPKQPIQRGEALS
jgi:alkylation response protein AidB-like acyl-CoA dehydrogenase